MGRPSKLTSETTAKIVDAIRLGATYSHAVSAAGIDAATFYRWMTDDRPDCAAFRDAVRAAEGAGAVALLANLQRAADGGSWQAAAWILERRYPDAYGRRRVEVTGKDGGPVQTPGGVVILPARCASIDEWTAAVAEHRAPRQDLSKLTADELHTLHALAVKYQSPDA